MFMRNLIAALLAVSVFTLSGCATSGSRSGDLGEAPKSLDVAMALKFEDIPIPSGFYPITPESFTFQNDVLRVGILKYAGGAKVDQVVNFYKDQMPLYNWRFMNMMEYGRRILNFDREDQTCIIVVEPAKMRTYVTITVAPKAGRATTYKSVQRDDYKI